jgi:hypothetical protein
LVALTIVFWLASALRQLIWARAVEQRDQLRRIELGQPTVLRRKALGSLVVSLVFAVGFRYASLSLLWAALAVCFLALSAFLLLMSLAVQAQPDRFPKPGPPTPEFLDRRVMWSRRAQPFVFALIFTWAYAWWEAGRPTSGCS